MSWSSRFQAGKDALLADPSVCEANRALWAQFFEYEEYKLKRQNGLAALDDACFNTLYSYVFRFRAINRWFENKPWKDLTKEDIKRVYDGLEDGTIRRPNGKAYEDRQSFYNKIFKSKPFRLAGKAELAAEVIEFSTEAKRTVRFLTEEGFRLLVSVLSKPAHLFLFWLAWDLGENIGALLKLARRDIIVQPNRRSGERELIVNLPQAKIKRSRQSRSEPTLYPETVRFGDMVLSSLGPGDAVFTMGHRAAAKVLASAVKKTGATTMPYNEPVRWKDFRSGMACHLLKTGWTRDEVNARLGHTPHSDALSAYINFLALDRDEPKQRLARARTEQLEVALVEAKQRAQLMGDRLQHQSRDFEVLRAEVAHSRLAIEELRRQLGEAVGLVQSAAVKLRHAG